MALRGKLFPGAGQRHFGVCDPSRVAGPTMCRPAGVQGIVCDVSPTAWKWGLLGVGFIGVVLAVSRMVLARGSRWTRVSRQPREGRIPAYSAAPHVRRTIRPGNKPAEG